MEKSLILFQLTGEKVNVLCRKLMKMSQTFTNWGGNLKFNPEQIAKPSSEAEILDLVKNAKVQGKQIRVVGSGHSWTHLIKTNRMLISLDQFQGLINLDSNNQIAEVKAGTSIRKLGELLDAKGFALENLGDIDVQSIAGALSTGTHGTGVNYGTLSTQLVGIRFINGLGEIVECSPTDKPELFSAAQISLGALGIIISMKLKVVPAFKMKLHIMAGHLDETLTKLETYKQENKHFEFYWMPYTKKLLLKLSNHTTEANRGTGFAKKFNDVFMENILLGLLMKITSIIPPLSQMVSKLIAATVSESITIDQSNKLFATVRWIKFNEMEYNIPADKFSSVIKEMEAAFEKHQFKVPFPIECRWVKGDNIMISPASGRDSAYIAIHQYIGMEYLPYFNCMEEIFRKHGGRPHYGKMNSAKAEDFEQLYPNWGHFKAIRQAQDPDGLFLNEYLMNIFNIKIGQTA